MRKHAGYDIAPGFKTKLLEWCSQSPTAFFFDSNTGCHQVPAAYDFIAAVDCVEEVFADADVLESFSVFHESSRDWLFGYLSYDIKNEMENLHSDNPDHLNFPLLYFCRPRYVLIGKGGRLSALMHPSVNPGEFDEMMAQIKQVTVGLPSHAADVHIKARLGKDEYIRKVGQLKQHIRLGDIYEINFCQEYYSENAAIDPLHVYRALNELSHSPFSGFCRFGSKYLLCASPERFLKRSGSRIVSQPIKGTAARGKTGDEDERMKIELAASEKERSENVMIVDLVRNDLSKIAKRGSVKVDELFGIYTFETVHQMISTVSAELKEDVRFTDIIKAAFPMGSMTGAPKVRAMELIEQYEVSRRGLYSGAVGYIDPAGNFDFNVVIRSILYDAASQYLSFTVGSAITDRSDPEKEYEECIIKARAMHRALGSIVPAI